MLSRAPQEIVQEYFKWFCSFPITASPACYNDGTKTIETNKDNAYIFLNPSFAGTSYRDLGTIKAGRKMFIPSCSFIGSEFESPGADISKLYKYADVDYANIEYCQVKIDGEQLDKLGIYRVRTEPFEVHYPDNDALFGVHGGTSKAVADGIYLVYEPPIGRHEVHYEAKINLLGNKDCLDPSADHIENVTYVFTVE